MKDGYSNVYNDVIEQVMEAKKVMVYVNFLDEYVQVMKGDFTEALVAGHMSGYSMETETGWQWDKTDKTIFIN